MVDKSKITKSTDLAGKGKAKGKGKKDEPTDPVPVRIENPDLAAAVDAAKVKGGTHVQKFDPAPTERPTNVYRERTQDGDFIWWTTEDGQEIGRKAINDYNELTQQNVLKGYELDIPFDVTLAQKVQALGGRKCKFYRKDGTSRSGVTFEDFVKAE